MTPDPGGLTSHPAPRMPVICQERRLLTRAPDRHSGNSRFRTANQTHARQAASVPRAAGSWNPHVLAWTRTTPGSPEPSPPIARLQPRFLAARSGRVWGRGMERGLVVGIARGGLKEGPLTRTFGPTSPRRGEVKIGDSA